MNTEMMLVIAILMLIAFVFGLVAGVSLARPNIVR